MSNAALTMVGLADAEERAHWMRYFGISERKLRAAVCLMGPNVIAVRLYLRKFR